MSAMDDLKLPNFLSLFFMYNPLIINANKMTNLRFIEMIEC